MVSKTKPDRCPHCGSTDIEQDPDVLDTWFSSWLWPFSTFGWPFQKREEEEFSYFYPTDTLVTAQEIIFFWVARMIMAGLEFAKDIPFHHVYIHGTVRDDTGTKMSKSLGNIIDPLEIIDGYGADALRFSIISITAQGQDVFLARNRFELGRNFANKVWNAARFILMNLRPEEVNVDLCTFFKGMKLNLPERWILSRFYATLTEVGRCLEGYKFNEAANSIYEFFWHQFCDWYVEIAKSSIREKTTQVILYKVLEKSLRILNPFMPFVTEEIWQNLSHSGESIMVQSWPHIQKEMISKEADSKMAILIDVVTSIRNLRANWRIPPTKMIEAYIRTRKRETEAILNANSSHIQNLAKVEMLNIGKVGKPKNAATSVLKDMEIFVPLAGLIDIEKEKARIRAQVEQVESDISSTQKRLKEKGFLAKAPKEVVQMQKARLGELKEKLEKLKDNFKRLE